MTAWTKEELAAVATAPSYEHFLAATGSDRSFDAWETKRRRINHVVLDADDDSAEARLYAILNTKARDAELKKKFEDAQRPELGEAPDIPPYVGFDLVFFDLETTGLKGNFGRILCCSFADVFGNVTTYRADDPAFAGTKLRDDSKLVMAIRDRLEDYDVIVGWNSKMYDVPMLNTRLLIHGEAPLRSMMHVDPMWKAGMGSLTLHSRRLDAVAKTFRLPVQKTELQFDILQDAAMGDSDAMDNIVEHCEHDVLALRGAFHILKPLIQKVTH